jgi:thiamine-phosphate pyrophosphorylase
MIVISNPIAVANEINLIHSLFEKGLELFHIRKPDFSKTDMERLVTAIGLKFRNRLVLHSHHELAYELEINRLHFTTKNRLELNTPTCFSNPYKSILEEYKKTGFHLSTSTHSIEEFNILDSCFEYAFLSPVYPSISKTNYSSEIDLFQAIKKRTNYTSRLVALGGIESNNIRETLKNGFDQVALLGTIWNNEEPLKNFELCKQNVLLL